MEKQSYKLYLVSQTVVKYSSSSDVGHPSSLPAYSRQAALPSRLPLLPKGKENVPPPTSQNATKSNETNDKKIHFTELEDACVVEWLEVIQNRNGNKSQA